MELLRGGAKVAIQPKVLQLLLVLLRHRARALTRTELFELVWADVRVGQDSLTRAIVQARRAIGDDRQEMIATVRGHGFRFAATVLEIPAGGSAAPAMPAGLIGREASLSALAAQLSQAHGGRGAIAWVSGVPGIGKTRLLEELAILARASAATVHFLRCHETPAQPPFWPWSSLVEELAQDASGARGRELRDAGAALEAPNAGLRAFDAVTRAIVGARGAGPLVVIVDDLQWADEGSLELLRFFVREIRDARVLVVGAYRDNAPSARALGAILQEYGSVSVPLRGLSREETARLVQARAGQEPSTSFATAIHERTGGSPLFIEQLLATEWATRALHDESRAAATSLDLERGLLEAFARHLDGLTSSCKDVLSWAALLGKEFDFAVLSAASGVEGNELLDHLDRAASARVVHRTAGRHAFVHPLIADVLYKSLTASERASRHRIVGQALEQLHAGALDLQAEAIAHHFFKAAPTGTARAAFEYSVRASRNAGRMGDAKRAVGLLQQALRALDLIADAHLERLDVQLELARALMSAGLADRACDALFDTVMLGRAVGQPSVASLALAELEKLAPGDPRIALARQEQV